MKAINSLISLLQNQQPDGQISYKNILENVVSIIGRIRIP